MLRRAKCGQLPVDIWKLIVSGAEMEDLKRLRTVSRTLQIACETGLQYLYARRFSDVVPKSCLESAPTGVSWLMLYNLEAELHPLDAPPRVESVDRQTAERMIRARAQHIFSDQYTSRNGHCWMARYSSMPHAIVISVSHHELQVGARRKDTTLAFKHLLFKRCSLGYQGRRVFNDLAALLRGSLQSLGDAENFFSDARDFLYGGDYPPRNKLATDIEYCPGDYDFPPPMSTGQFVALINGILELPHLTPRLRAVFLDSGYWTDNQIDKRFVTAAGKILAQRGVSLKVATSGGQSDLSIPQSWYLESEVSVPPK